MSILMLCLLSLAHRHSPATTNRAIAPPIDRIACLVVDIRMDGMNGLDLQERLVADRAGLPGHLHHRP